MLHHKFDLMLFWIDKKKKTDITQHNRVTRVLLENKRS